MSEIIAIRMNILVALSQLQMILRPDIRIAKNTIPHKCGVEQMERAVVVSETLHPNLDPVFHYMLMLAMNRKLRQPRPTVIAEALAWAYRLPALITEKRFSILLRCCGIRGLSRS